MTAKGIYGGNSTRTSTGRGSAAVGGAVRDYDDGIIVKLSAILVHITEALATMLRAEGSVGANKVEQHLEVV